MIPKDDKNYMGIEIEMIFKIPKDQVKKILKQTLTIPFELGTDGSIKTCDYCSTRNICRPCSYGIPCPSHQDYMNHIVTSCSDIPTRRTEFSGELRLLINESEITKVTRQLNKVFKDIDARTNASCGLHVHLDARNRSPVRLFENLLSCQSLFFKVVDKTRQANSYCYKNNSKNFKQEARNLDKYRAINLCSFEEHQTVEVRIHEGTTDTDKIEGWLLTLKTIASQGKPKKNIKTVNTFIKEFKPKSNKIEKYLSGKIKENRKLVC